MAPILDTLNAFVDYPQASVSYASSGPLSGLRLAVKDIYDVTGYPTGCGNPSRLAESALATRNATAVQMLLDAGARFAGKTQTDELAFSLMGSNAHFPQPVNKAAPERVTGGSSSGSAAAVAGSLVEVALGSDTGGSIRAPSSFCGLIGLRTTHGRIPVDGVMPLAPSLDTVGWFADDIESYEAVGKVLLGRDPHRGSLTRPLRSSRLDAQLTGDAEAQEYFRMTALVAKAMGEAAIGEISPLAEPEASIDDLYWCFRRIQAREAWATHGEWISSGNRDLGPGIFDRFAFGRTIDDATAHAESIRRRLFQAQIANMLGKDGVLVLPTVPGAAPLRRSSQDQLQAYRERALRLLCWSGLSGFPQISLPLGNVDGAPFGVSLLGPAGSDIALIRLGRKVLDAAKKG